MSKAVLIALGLLSTTLTAVAAWLFVASVPPDVDRAPADQGKAHTAALTAPAAPPAARKEPADAGKGSERPQPGPTFDVVRLSADGVSVLAGRSAPDQTIIVTLEGREIARARSNGDGEWTVLTEQPIPPGKAQLTVTAIDERTKARTAGQSLQVTVAGTQKPQPSVPVAQANLRAPAVPGALPPPAAPAAAERQSGQAALNRFAAFVEQSRTSPPGTTQPDPERVPVPVPITFVTAEAAMTSEGRAAAKLLASYLRTTKPQSILLTGHADSRGPDGYNMALSRQRLAAIERFLREEGYSGGLELIPMGESLPYGGVDRQRLTLDEIYQADRRVELKITR